MRRLSLALLLLLAACSAVPPTTPPTPSPDACMGNVDDSAADHQEALCPDNAD